MSDEEMIDALKGIKEELIISGFREVDDMNASTQKAIDMIINGNEKGEDTFKYNLHMKPEQQKEVSVTPVYYLRDVLTSLKYNENRPQALKVLAILDKKY